MNRQLRTWLQTAAAVTASTALLAACSSSSGDAAERTTPPSPDTTEDAATPEETAAPEDPATIRIAELSTANFLTLSRDSDLLDDSLSAVGATAEWLGPFSAPTAAYETVYAGQADAGSTGASRLIVWASEERPIVAVAVESYNGDSQGVTAAPDSGVETLEDLYGKTVAVGPAPGGTGDYIFEKAFDSAGLDSSQVEKVYLADTDAAVAFASGEIDAWSTYDQFFATAQSTPGSLVLARGNEIGSHNASIHFVTKDLLDAHPVAVRAFFDGLTAQAEATAQDPSIITDSYRSSGAGTAVLDVLATFDIPVIRPLDTEATANLSALADEYLKYGFIETAPDLSASTFDVTALG